MGKRIHHHQWSFERSDEQLGRVLKKDEDFSKVTKYTLDRNSQWRELVETITFICHCGRRKLTNPTTEVSHE